VKVLGTVPKTPTKAKISAQKSGAADFKEEKLREPVRNEERLTMTGRRKVNIRTEDIPDQPFDPGLRDHSVPKLSGNWKF